MVFPLNLTSVELRAEADGSITLVDSAGAALGRIPRGFMEDSNYDAQSGESAASTGVSYEIITVDGRSALKVTADSAWVRDPARVFPIRVDPTISPYGNASTYVHTNDDVDNWAKTSMKTGKSTTNVTARGFLRFDNFSYGDMGKRIHTATLKVNVLWAGTCATSTLRAYDITSTWNPTAITTWATAPAISANDVGTVTQAPTTQVCVDNSAKDPSMGQTWSIPLNIDLVNRWTSGGANNGVALVGTLANTTEWKWISSVNSSRKPVLEVTYTDNTVPQLEGQYPPNGYGATTLTPELLASATDTDNWPKPLSYYFAVRDTQGTLLFDSGSTPQASRSYVVPEGKLQWGKTYLWSVTATDGASASLSQLYAISTRVPQPLITSGLSQNSSAHGFDARIGNYTTEAIDAQVNTVGPPLAIQRSYNSRDPRTAGAFGAGWSSVLDSRATKLNTGVVITYPSGQDVAFGLVSAGVYAPPSSASPAVLKVEGLGFSLKDNGGTTYLFTQPLGGDVFGLKSITDTHGRTLTLDYNGSNQVTSLTSASGRKLTIGWAGSRVGEVKTDLVDAAVPTSFIKWQYTYTGNQLSTVCPPTSPAACTRYTYQSNSLYPTALLDAGPQTYLRLNEAAGTATAQSSAVDSLDIGVGRYYATDSAPGGLAGSTATATVFNGISSHVELAKSPAFSAKYQSVSLRFKTTGTGVLYSLSSLPLPQVAGAGWNPVLYIGTDGKLRGKLWNGSTETMTTTAPVNDDVWHDVAITASMNTQSLYVDGAHVETKSGELVSQGYARAYIGAGQWNTWPGSAGDISYFQGQISDFAFFNRPLSPAEVSLMRAAATTPSAPLWTVHRPSGDLAAKVIYDPVTGTVTEVTDANSGLWKVGAPTRGDSGQAYASSVLAAAPTDYFRLNDTTNTVNGGVGQFNEVTLGVDGGPLGPDQDVASFDGTASYLKLPGNNLSISGPVSVSMWFKANPGSSGVLYSQAITALPNVAGGGWNPAIYIGTDGKLRAEFWQGSVNPITTGQAVNDGQWHHVAVAAGTNVQRLYLDGVKIGADLGGALVSQGEIHAYAGAGQWTGWPSTSGNLSYFSGQIAEFAFFHRELSADQTRAQYSARDLSRSWREISSSEAATAAPATASVWFQLPAGSTGGGVLYSFQSGPVSDVAVSNWNPALYVGTDGKLRGEFWTGTVQPITSTALVNDGQWHHAALTVGSNTQTLYLDGAAIGTLSGTVSTVGTNFAYAGTGKWELWTGSAGKVGYWSGKLTGLSLRKSQLSATDIAAEYSAGMAPGAPDVSPPTGTPTRTVRVTDPMNGIVTSVYDLTAGARQLEIVDARNKRTIFGYDVAGSLRSVTDPNKNTVITERDDRGNIKARTTCQDLSERKCSTTYYEYFPPGTDPQDPRIGKLTAVRDARSSSPTDNTFLTTYTYDASGDLIETTDPFGRKQKTEFNTPAGVPAGLPTKSISAAGAAQTVTYLPSGDISEIVDAAGVRTVYTYDGLGRMFEQKAISDAHPAGLITRMTYDGLGRVRTVTEPPSMNQVTGATHTKMTTNVYDFDGQITSTTYSDLGGGDAPRVVTMEYTLGKKTSQSDARNHKTTYAYDSFGRLIRQTAPDGTVTELGYDAAGNQTTVKVNGQLLETRGYDDGNRLALVTDVMGWQTLHTYTDNNLLVTTSRRNPSNGETFVDESNTYDAAGNLTAKTTNNGATVTTYGIDAAGRTAWETLDPANLKRTISYAYGVDDTVQSTTVSGPTGSQTVDATYDVLGRMRTRSVRMPSGTGGPTGWWQLNETGGTVAADSTASGRHGTYAGTAMWSDSAATMNGGSDVYTSAPVLDTTNSYTVSGWAKIAPGSASGTVVSQDANIPTALGSGFSLYHGDNWGFVKPVGDGGWGASWLDSGVRATAGEWTFVVGVYDKSAGTIRLYVNGVQKASLPTPAGFAATGVLTIGRMKANGGPHQRFSGALDNVQAYQRALTSTEVTTLFTAGRNGVALGSNAITTLWTRNQLGQVTAETDPNGNVAWYSYDEAGRLVEAETPTVSTEENGVIATAPVVSSIGYDTFGGVVEEKDGRGTVTTHKRDANGSVFETTSPSYTAPGSSTPLTQVVKTVYDNMGRVSEVEDPLAGKTYYTYNQFGQVTTVKTPDLGVTTYTYHPNGHPASVTDPTGALTQATYDFLGRQATTTQFVRRSGQPTQAFTTTYLYQSFGGWLSSAVSPDPVRRPNTYAYNAAGESTTVTDFFGNVTTHEYDFAGRLVGVKLPDNSRQTITLDSAGRPVAQKQYSKTGALLATSSATYDNNGLVATSTDPRGTIATYSYDAVGRLTQATQPISSTDSITTAFGYDAVGNRTRYTDGRGNRFLTTYNSWGLPEKQIDADDKEFTTVYDVAGRVAEVRSPGGVTAAYTYDAVGNLKRVAGSGAEIATTDRVYDYDAVGRVTSLSGSGGTNTLSYDDRGLLTSVAGPSGNSSFSWTPDSLMESRTDAAGTTSYTYDQSGRLKTAGNATAGIDLAYGYNGLSQINQITYGSNQNRRIFTYDDFNRLTLDQLKTSGGTVLAGIDYDWDLNGNLTKKDTTNFAGAANNSYTYDLANRLKSWNNGSALVSYGYDKSGNLTQYGGREFAYDNGNRLVSSSDGTTYEYTQRGTLKRTTTGTVGLDSISDAFGQVIKQYHSATAFSQYDYDGLGRDIQTGMSYTGTGNDLSQDPTASYIRGLGGDLLGSRTGTTSKYSWTDLHSDVVGQFTATGTSLAGSTTYEPYGKVVSSAGMQGSLGYQSAWTDSQTKRVNMHARWYNPDTGQFDSRDTVDVPNRFSYADNSPLVNTDPTGHWATSGTNDHVGGLGIGGGWTSNQGEDNGFNAWRTHQEQKRHREAREAALQAEAGARAWLTHHLQDCQKQDSANGFQMRDDGFHNRADTCQNQTCANRTDNHGTQTFKFCTTLVINDDGSVTINGISLTKDQLGGLDPKVIAQKIDLAAGGYGGYSPDGQRGDKAHVTALVIGVAIQGAAQHQAELEQKRKEAECQADFFCSNKDAALEILAGPMVAFGCQAFADDAK